MKIIEIIVENVQTDFRIRKLTRDVLRGLEANANRPINPGAIDLGNGPQLCFWMPTMFPDLAIGLVTGEKDPGMTQLDMVQCSLPETIRYFINYPLAYSGLRISARRQPTRGEAVPKDPKYLSVPDAYKAAQRAVRDGDIRTGNSIVTAIKDEDPLTNKEDLSTLFHEMTHYMDHVRAEGRMPGSSDAYLDAIDAYSPKGTPGSAYFNDPLERNAFYNMVLYQLDRSPGWFQQPFPEFMQHVMGWMRKDFLNSLTPSNRQRLIQRLYQLWSSKGGSDKSGMLAPAARLPALQPPAATDASQQPVPVG